MNKEPTAEELSLKDSCTFEEFQKLVDEGYLEHKVINGESHYRLTKKGLKEIGR